MLSFIRTVVVVASLHSNETLTQHHENVPFSVLLNGQALGTGELMCQPLQGKLA